LDRAIVNPVINEMGSDAQFLGQLRNGQESFNAARMRLILLDHNAVPEANLSDRAWQDRLTPRRSMPVGSKAPRNFFISDSLGRELDYFPLHFLQVGEL